MAVTVEKNGSSYEDLFEDSVKSDWLDKSASLNNVWQGVDHTKTTGDYYGRGAKNANFNSMRLGLAEYAVSNSASPEEGMKALDRWQSGLEDMNPEDAARRVQNSGGFINDLKKHMAYEKIFDEIEAKEEAKDRKDPVIARAEANLMINEHKLRKSQEIVKDLMKNISKTSLQERMKQVLAIKCYESGGGKKMLTEMRTRAAWVSAKSCGRDKPNEQDRQRAANMVKKEIMSKGITSRASMLAKVLDIRKTSPLHEGKPPAKLADVISRSLAKDKLVMRELRRESRAQNMKPSVDVIVKSFCRQKAIADGVNIKAGEKFMDSRKSSEREFAGKVVSKAGDYIVQESKGKKMLHQLTTDTVKKLKVGSVVEIRKTQDGKLEVKAEKKEEKDRADSEPKKPEPKKPKDKGPER